MPRNRRDAAAQAARLGTMRPFIDDDWRRWHREGCTWLPASAVARDVSLPASWETWAGDPAFALLESAQAGRYTYICACAERVIRGERDHVQIRSASGDHLLETRAGAPLDVLQGLLNERRAPSLPDWPAMSGGLIGLLGYDLVHTWERLPWAARRDLDVPLFAAIEPRELFIYDHVQRTLGVVVWGSVDRDRPLDAQFVAARARAEELVARWSEGGAGIAASGHASAPRRIACDASPPVPSFTPEAFQAAAGRIHDYIAAGDTYQVNLSQRTSRATELPAEAIYESLRRVNPSPYMGLFKLHDFALVCGSPELLVKLQGDMISSRPIAGTRPRGTLAAEDTHFSAELFASEKERAEHLMLVDLIRNDVGRVAAFGSVRVPEFMALERYSHVMHIVSQVEGRLAPGRTWVDVFKAMFPGGTITGCPKIRTMEIIEELEPVGRGYYTGSLGWISYRGEMELNIVIRSMLVRDGIAHVQAGAGVVADSNPERELDESRRKAHALWVALERAEAARATRFPA